MDEEPSIPKNDIIEAERLVENILSKEEVVPVSIP